MARHVFPGIVRFAYIVLCAVMAACFVLLAPACALAASDPCAPHATADAERMFQEMADVAPEDVPAEEAPFEYLPVFERVETDKKWIAITVDDCYQVQNLRTIIDLAHRQGGKLTIFPIGDAAAQKSIAPVLRQAVFDYGFEIGNHTWSHQRIFRLSEEEMAREIWRQQDMINQVLGVNYQQSFFRLMGGDGEYDQRTHNYLKQLGYKGIAHWSLSGSDASMDMIKQNLRPGAIYLFHATDSDTAKLKEFIPYAVSKGYTLVTMTELCGMPANTWTDLSTADADMPAPEAYTVEYRQQSRGDYSWSVVQIQQRLVELGYLSKNAKSAVSGTAADGVYGKGTEAAIERFQQAIGLEVTGVADVETQRLLFGDASDGDA